MKIELGERQIFEAPKSYQQLLRRAGGLTPTGKPLLRLVWGWSRLAFIGGVYGKDTGLLYPGTTLPMIIPAVMPLHLAPKYWDADKWYLEMWRPPLYFGTPESWHAANVEIVPDGCVDPPAGTLVEAFGPYPDQGDYEALFAFNAFPGQPLPYYAVEMSLELVNNARRLSGAARYAAKLRAHREAEQAERQRFDAEVTQEFGRLVPTFGDGPHVAVPRSYDPATRKVLVN